MKAIVAVNLSWGIGRNDELLYHIPEDLKRFKELTTGKTVVYGRKTLETFPGGKPLPNRKNIILSHQKGLKVKGAKVVHSIEELKQQKGWENAFVIGGMSIYTQLLKLCDEAYVTRIDDDCIADAYFPNLSYLPDWELVKVDGQGFYEDCHYRFLIYERKNPA